MLRGRTSFFILTLMLVAVLLTSVGSAEELDLSFNQLEFSQIYQLLSDSQGLNVLVDPSVVGTGTFRLQGVSFEEALELISQHSGYGYRLDGKTLVVASPARLQAMKSTGVRYVRTTALSAQEVLDALALVIPRSDVYVQPEGGLVVLYGTDEVLDRAEDLLSALDASKTALPSKTTDRSLLEVFQELSAEMGLNLIADPALEGKRIFIHVVNQEPEELIRQIQQIVPLKVERTANTLVVASLAELSTERMKVYNLNYAEPEATQNVLTAFVPAENIRVDADRKSVVVKGTELELAEVDLFMNDFDTALPQVVLEVWVQEISTDGLRSSVWRDGLLSFSGGDARLL